MFRKLESVCEHRGDWGWLGQCPSALNESPDCDTNDVFGEHVTTALTGATRMIDARLQTTTLTTVCFYGEEAPGRTNRITWIESRNLMTITNCLTLDT